MDPVTITGLVVLFAVGIAGISAQGNQAEDVDSKMGFVDSVRQRLKKKHKLQAKD